MSTSDPDRDSVVRVEQAGDFTARDMAQSIINHYGISPELARFLDGESSFRSAQLAAFERLTERMQQQIDGLSERTQRQLAELESELRRAIDRVRIDAQLYQNGEKAERKARQESSDVRFGRLEWGLLTVAALLALLIIATLVIGVLWLRTAA